MRAVWHRSNAIADTHPPHSKVRLSINPGLDVPSGEVRISKMPCVLRVVKSDIGFPEFVIVHENAVRMCGAGRRLDSMVRIEYSKRMSK